MIIFSEIIIHKIKEKARRMMELRNPCKQEKSSEPPVTTSTTDTITVAELD